MSITSDSVNMTVTLSWQRATNGQAVTRIFIDQGKQPQASAIMGTDSHKVIAPHLIGPLGSLPDTPAIIRP